MNGLVVGFSVGYAAFVAIDGREVGIPDRGARYADG